MLGKLLKYEIKSTARTFLPLYGALIIMSLIIGFFVSTEEQSGLIAGIFICIYVILIIAIIVVTIVVIIQRFYKNLLCDEGYLMFTLPVTTSQLVVGKFITALIWQCLSAVVGCFSVMCIMLVSSMPFKIGELFNLIQGSMEQLQAHTNLNIGLLFFEIIILAVCGIGVSIQMVYAAISLGHLSNKRPVLLSIVAYAGIIIAMQIVASFISKIVELIFNLNESFWNSFGETTQSVYAVLGAGIFASLITMGVFYIVSVVLLKKKLNLS